MILEGRCVRKGSKDLMQSRVFFSYQNIHRSFHLLAVGNSIIFMIRTEPYTAFWGLANTIAIVMAGVDRGSALSAGVFINVM